MAIKVKIKKDFGEFCLDIEFESASNRIGVLGASGAGKTMILKGIAGIEAMDEEYIEINGKVLADRNNKIHLKPQQRKVGYVFQNYALFSTKTVAKNIMAGMEGSKADKHKRLAEVVEQFQLQGLEQRFPSELSGGQQQRVALARIIAYEPEIILLDEPFSAMDEFLKERLQQEMMEMLKGYAGIVILVSHNRDEIYRISDELLVIDSGRIVGKGNTKAVFRTPETVEAARLTGCKNIVAAKALDAHSLEIVDWGVVINSEKSLPAKFDYIGYRAHDFIPVDGEQRPNCIPVEINSIARLPFEDRYYLKSQGEEICWTVPKRLGEPTINSNKKITFLEIDVDKISFLIKA